MPRRPTTEASAHSESKTVDVLCFSHLRWDFVYQRPNHLMARAAMAHRVFYIEEPVSDAKRPYLESCDREGVTVVVPHLAADPAVDETGQLRRLLDELVQRESIETPVLWYYTPMALPWSRHLAAFASARVYDCMDHLAGFHGAPEGLLALEAELLRQADLVFTGGSSLLELKGAGHPSAWGFPSSVDTAHFGRARDPQPDPSDQADIPRPRIGYFGVIDERLDLPLLRVIADQRRDWQFVLVGPVVKIDPASLPTGPNVHALGPRSYGDLPAYLAGWDAAIMPFARNDATRYISPTKTPEYLAGGRPVASTSIRDVVVPYAEAGLVHIGDTPAGFIAAIEAALAEDSGALKRRADTFLANGSWDRTWADMERLVEGAVAKRARVPARRSAVPRTRTTEPAGAPSMMAGARGGD